MVKYMDSDEMKAFESDKNAAKEHVRRMGLERW